MADLLGLWLAPAMLALVPAMFRLRRGQTMSRYLDDPAFPERLQGSRTLLTAVFAGVVATLVFAWPARTWWTLPLLLLSFLAAGWPLRRAMYGETWRVGTYVWFYVRLFVAIYGFWNLLMAAPWLTRFDGPPWLAPLVVGVVLVAWNENHGAVLRWILRTRPVGPSGLLERCRAIVAKSKVSAPNIEYVDMNGGVLINALALPDTERSTVLFTSSLIERMDEDETTAIFAHEVAHLEHFNPAHLRKLRWAGWAIVATAVTIGPLMRSYAPQFESWVGIWPFVVLAYIIVLTSARQKHETESDLRAVALTGDAEALVRGLVKLHALAKMPRRLDPNIEVNASHPSLARRVQAIRAASGVTATSLDRPVTLTNGSTVVMLHADRLAWTEADGTSHALPYATLDELRIEAGDAGAARLSASDSAGRRWTVPLADADVARAQAALDIVDVRLRPSPTGAGVWKTVGTLVSLLALVASLGAGQLSSMVVALLATLFFERPLARAAGAAGLAGGAIALRDGGSREMAMILILSSALLLFVSYRDRREGFSKGAARAVSLLGVLALSTLTLVALGGGSGGLLAAHQLANSFPAAAVFALAFASAAAWPRRRGWRQAAMAAAAVGAIVLVIGDTRLLDAVLQDPFLQHVDQPAIDRLTGSPSKQMTFDFTPAQVLLSPRAESVAARVGSDDYEDSSYFIGPTGGKLVEVQADAVLFVDDRRMLIAEPVGKETRLRLVDADNLEISSWEEHLDLRNPTIAIDRSAVQWRVLGDDGKGNFIRVSGAIDGGGIERREWAAGAAAGRRASIPLSADGPRLLMASTEYGVSTTLTGLSSLSPFMYWMRPYRSETQFTLVTDSTATDAFRSNLFVECRSSLLIEEGPICAAHDGSRYHLAMLNTADASVTPLAMFDRAMTFEVAPGWIAGWWHTPFALDRKTGRMVLLEDRRRGDRWAYLMTASEDSIGVLVGPIGQRTHDPRDLPARRSYWGGSVIRYR